MIMYMSHKGLASCEDEVGKLTALCFAGSQISLANFTFTPA